MKKMQRTSPLSVLTFAVVGIAIGLLVQFARSSQGQAPLVPPVSLAFTLLVIAAVLLVLAILLHRAVRSGDSSSSENSNGSRNRQPRRRPVNPFHAVRLLAGARAGQFAGALFGGFGGGLALQLLARSVMPPSATWLPMILVLGAGAALVVCGVIAEWLCRVPPEGPESEGDAEGTGSGAPSENPA